MNSEKVSISSRSATHHAVEVASPALIQWEVNVERQDIKLYISWTPDGASKSFLVYPPATIKESSGTWAATTSGTLVFEFDNTFSLLSGKEVTLALNREDLPSDSSKYSPATTIDPLDSYLMNRLCMRGMELFFSNRFLDAEEFFRMEHLRVPIFSLAYSSVAFMRALMTFAPDDIVIAQKRLSATQVWCFRFDLWGRIYRFLIHVVCCFAGTLFSVYGRRWFVDLIKT